jgi:hypothetical protein
MDSPNTMILIDFSTTTLTQWLDAWGDNLVALFVAIESSGIPFPGERPLPVTHPLPRWCCTGRSLAMRERAEAV